MFCANCGKPLDEGTRFCLSCGALQEIADTKTENSALDEEREDLSEEAAVAESSVIGVDDGSDAFEETVRTEPSVSEVKPEIVRSERRMRAPMRVVPTVLVCVLFSVLTVALALGSAALWEARDILRNGSASAATVEVDPLNFRAKDVITDTETLQKALADSGIADVDFGEIGDDETLGEVVERAFVRYGVTEDEAEQFLEKSELMPYLAEVVSAYENFLYTGEDVKPVTDAKLKSTALSCMDYASKEMGFIFRPDYEQRLDDLFKKNKDEIRSLNPSEALGVGGSYIRYWFSLPVVITVSVLTLLAAVLAGIITRRVDAAFITLGIPMLLSGYVFLYVGLFPKLALELVDIPSAAIGDSAEILSPGFVTAGTVEAVIGLVFIAAFVVYRVFASKLAKRKELQNV